MEQLLTAARRLRPERRHLLSDSIAGLTFAVVNVPQAMAHALLATVNPMLGIYTLMVAVPIGAVFTSSVYMNVSSTAALSVAAGAVLADIPAGQKLEALAVLVLLAGVIQLLMGLFRLGFLIRFVSGAVMTGFLNGVAVLIILGQLSDLTGYKSAFSNRVAQAFDLLLRIGQIDVQATTIGGLTLGLMVLLLLTPLAAVRLHHLHCRGDRLAGPPEPPGPARSLLLRHGPNGRRHRRDSAFPARTGASPAVAFPVAAAAGLLRGRHRPDPGRRRQPGHPQPRR